MGWREEFPLVPPPENLPDKLEHGRVSAKYTKIKKMENYLLDADGTDGVPIPTEIEM